MDGDGDGEGDDDGDGEGDDDDGELGDFICLNVVRQTESLSLSLSPHIYFNIVYFRRFTVIGVYF